MPYSEHHRFGRTGSFALAALLVGAVAIPAHAQTTPIDAPAPGGRITGVVYDSLARRPLAGAVVQLVALEGERATYASHSDSSGTFTIAGLASGRYALGFFHPVLDSLWVELPPRAISVPHEGTVRADLGVPASITLLTRYCGARGARDSTGLLIGQLVDTSSGEPVADGIVTVEWVQFVLGRREAKQETPVVRVRSDASGRFALCGLPSDGELLASASRGVDSSGAIPVQVPPRGLVRRDFAIASTRSVVLSASDSGAVDTTGMPNVNVRRGDARLRGSVHDATQRPIRGALVEVWGSGLSQSAGEDGDFVLVGLPAGTQILEVRALGFEPRRIAVDLADGRTATVALVLAARSPVLDTVLVRAKVFERDRTGFLRRRKRYPGYFFDAEYLKRRPLFSATDLMQEVPSATVVRRAGVGVVYFRQHGTYCLPSAFVDGFKLPQGSKDIDIFVQPSDIAAVEVYPRGKFAPIEYMDNECGSIAIWTHRTIRSSR